MYSIGNVECCTTQPGFCKGIVKRRLVWFRQVIAKPRDVLCCKGSIVFRLYCECMVTFDIVHSCVVKVKWRTVRCSFVSFRNGEAKFGFVK